MTDSCYQVLDTVVCDRVICYVYRFSSMQRWTVNLEGGPRRVNHAAVAINEKIYSFGGYCTGEDYETTRPMDVHILDTGTSS